MKITKIAVTALLSAAALGLAGGTANGQVPTAATEISGTDRGVAYTTSWTPDRSSVTTTLAGGRFVGSPDRAAVTVTAPNGAPVGTIPMAYQNVTLNPRVDRSGTALTVDRPANAPVGVPQNIANPGQIFGGVAIGCVVGALIGLIFLIVGAIPGCVIGAVIGGVIAAHQPG